MPASHVPEGFHSVTPFLTVEGVEQVLEFLRDTFGAREVARTSGDDGAVRHAQVLIEGSMLELSAARPPEQPARPGSVHVFVADVDATHHRAVAAGATSLFEPTDMPWGNRESAVCDPAGVHWYLGTCLRGTRSG